MAAENVDWSKPESSSADGQSDPTKLVNLGNHRWAFKPEIGYSQRWGHWVVDAYGAAWFYTTNPEFFSHNQYFPGSRTQSENPTAVFEGHLSYDFKPRLWVSLDGNFWYGGETSLNGFPNPKTVQRNSRIGATAAIPISKHQSVKISYNNGAYINYGGNYQNISLAWQYSQIQDAENALPRPRHGEKLSWFTRHF
jgi:hypothetical protein